MTLKVNVALSRKELYALNDLFRHVPRYEEVRELHDKVKAAVAKAERLNNERAFREEERRKKQDDFRQTAATIIIKHTKDIVQQVPIEGLGVISGRFTRNTPEPQEIKFLNPPVDRPIMQAPFHMPYGKPTPDNALVADSGKLVDVDYTKLEARIMAHYVDEGHLIPYIAKTGETAVITPDMSNKQVAEAMGITEDAARAIMFPLRYGVTRKPSPKDEYLGKKKR